MNNKEMIKSLVLLHIVLLIYSLGGICSKLAAQQEFLSGSFVLFYGIVLADLFFYALLWQQILKRLPLVMAYANKAVTVLWGLIWGMIFFQEEITLKKIVGSIVIVIGIYFVVSGEENM